jgi:hypothetical protein
MDLQVRERIQSRKNKGKKINHRIRKYFLRIWIRKSELRIRILAKHFGGLTRVFFYTSFKLNSNDQNLVNFKWKTGLLFLNSKTSRIFDKTVRIRMATKYENTDPPQWNLFMFWVSRKLEYGSECTGCTYWYEGFWVAGNEYRSM